MPKATLSINQACCWALFLFHCLSLCFLVLFFLFFLVHNHSSHKRLLCGDSIDVLSLTLILAVALNQLGGQGQNERNWGGWVTEVRSLYLKTPSSLLLLMFGSQSWLFFHLCDKSLHYGRRSDSSAVFRLWDKPTGAQSKACRTSLHTKGC